MASSLQSYLKRYTSSTTDERKPKKKKKAKPAACSTASSGIRIIDDSAVWQREIKDESAGEEDEDDAPQVVKDVEVKRMQKMEALKVHRPYLFMGDDGSGWVTLKDSAKPGLPSEVSKPFPLRNSHGDSPELSPLRKSEQAYTISDLLPPRNARHDTPDLSAPRKSASPSTKSWTDDVDLSPSRKKIHDTPDLRKNLHSSPDLSPLRKKRYDSPDFSPPRKKHCGTPDLSPPRTSQRFTVDISSPRKGYLDSSDLSPPRKILHGNSRNSDKLTDGMAAGLQIANDMVEEIQRKKKENAKRLAEMDPRVSGRGAEIVYRDKRGRRLESLDELMRLQQVDKKPEEKVLEWGKGLAQKKEIEARQAELEAEKYKPFARSRDDPELDNLLKERIRWGDPMAHLVKKKKSELILEDFGEREQMKESGFIIPQNIPSHSWLKRGISAPANRYGIKPGRHWDGVDRSTGFERDMFKRQNEKKATELEAYLWSVSEM